MAKHVTYRASKTVKTNERIRRLLRELPASCTDYFRAISQITSPLTRLAYAYDLRLFFQYLTSESVTFANSSPPYIAIEDIAKITARDIAGFQEYLMQYVKQSADPQEKDADHSPIFVQNSELGIMRKLCSVRSYFDYLFKNELIPANVATLVSLPRKRQKPIVYMEKHEVDRMMAAVVSGEGLTKSQQHYQKITQKRDIAILMMFLGTGIRVSELVGLDLDDIDFRNSAFLVTRKGGDRVILYFADGVADALQEYMQDRKAIQPQPGHEQALFLSLQKRRITQRAVENLVKKYAIIGAPLKKNVSPHKLRSTFGTNLYEETGDIYLVADALGHADVNTTRRHYAAMSDARRREASQRISLPDISRISTPDMPNYAGQDDAQADANINKN